MAAAIALLIVAGGVLYFTVFNSAEHEKILTQNIKPVTNIDTTPVKQQYDENQKKADTGQVSVKAEKETKGFASAEQKAKKKELASTPAASGSVIESKNLTIITTSANELEEVAKQAEPDFKNGAVQKADSFIRSTALIDDQVTDKSISMNYSARAKRSGGGAGNKMAKSERAKSADTYQWNNNDGTTDKSTPPPAMPLKAPPAAAPTTAPTTMFAEKTALAKTVIDTGLTDAMNSYKQKQYNEAAIKFDRYLNAHAFNEKATFYDAISNLNINNATVALSQLNTVLSNDQSQYYDAARWYKSLALIKLNRMKEAKSLLEEIKNSNSKYANDAAKMLEGL